MTIFVIFCYRLFCYSFLCNSDVYKLYIKSDYFYFLFYTSDVVSHTSDISATDIGGQINTANIIFIYFGLLISIDI